MGSMQSEVPAGQSSGQTMTCNAIPGDHRFAVCGMALRLPGGLESPQQFWDFLLSKGDARSRVPESRYNISAYHSSNKIPGTIGTEYGYFLDDKVKLGALDASRFSLSRAELEAADPQQRRMLEVVRECFDDAGEPSFRGRSIGCFMGSYGEDWLELQTRDPQQSGPFKADGYSDFMLSNRISYEMDLRGPSMTIRTACSSALTALSEAIKAIRQGDCDSAIIGGSNLIFAPGMTAFMSEKGVLSPDGSCKSFSVDANGYARGEAVTAVYVKPLDAAIRDGNPIRAVIRSAVCNSDGKTPGISQPGTETQEALMRWAYKSAGITNYSDTAFVECHGTGTQAGDPVETKAVANVFGNSGVYIGSVKPNLGHSEGAAGLTSLIKGVLMLENRIIPPNIKFAGPNPKIPFKEGKLTVPLEPTPWPESQYERVSINSFGIGGSNAHVVLDSARNFTPVVKSSDASTEPQLLLLSANSAKSLQKTIASFSELIPSIPDQLSNLAYTLGRRREHLPHRSFVVVNKNQVGAPSPIKKVPQHAPALVMVFTGQGAQWPRMGRDLLLQAGSTFQKTIKLLDKHLQGLPDAPKWSLEKELLKPVATSQVHSAELSQPLCTAVQIALVDHFAALGVVPTAVVGHSSGEIAAAYAAGALTEREAIIASWQRGLVVKGQTKAGAMAAVGLGWKDVELFLSPPNVIMACENSPKSVTISGDAKCVQEAINKIKQAQPGITARLLKVDKAYHSYHMRDVGGAYSSVVEKNLKGRPATKSFFSSVTGKEERDLVLNAEYWQRNLESPVLFRTAVAAVLNRFDDIAFLEVGPHAALAGPVRQTLAERSSKAAPYVSSLVRGENGVECLLSAVGKLFELNYPVNLSTLFPKGSTLSDLPHYEWDHDVNYWRESRIGQEWRNPQYPRHPLLGVRQLESSGLEPSWRNLLRVKDIEWVREHKIEDDIVLPGAGYIAIAGEAIRQVSGLNNGYSIRRMVLKSAMILKENTSTEVITTLTPQPLTDSVDSKWFNFSIVSHNGHVWTKHCSGQIAAIPDDEVQELDSTANITSFPRKIEPRKHYDFLHRAGLVFGPLFKRLTDMQTSTQEQLAIAKVSEQWAGDEAQYHLHPSIIDSCIQSAFLAALLGKAEAKDYRRIPTRIDQIDVRQCPLDVKDLRVSASATYLKGTKDIVGQIQQTIADGKVVMHMEGLVMSPLEEAENISGTHDLETTARLTWGPHLDFLDAATLIKPSFPHSTYNPLLDELVRLCMIYSNRQLLESNPEIPHMIKYRDWIGRQINIMNQDGKWADMLALDNASIQAKTECLVQQLRNSPVAACAIVIQSIANSIRDLVMGVIEPLDLLMTDNLLYKLYVVIDACDRSEFIQHLAHTKPNLRVLEIGAGTGATAESLLRSMTLPGVSARALFSKYTFTDISPGFFPAAKERFQAISNMDYRVLDISKDPFEQGFKDEKYDLILATNVIHATKSLQQSLQNINKLLDTDGRLLLHELHSITKWPNFIWGILSGWWLGGSDGRLDEPYVLPERWEHELQNAGFDGLDSVTLDAEAPHHVNSIMVAKPKSAIKSIKKRTISLLGLVDNEPDLAPVAEHFISKGYEIQKFKLGDELPKSQDIVSLLDYNKPFFHEIEETSFKQLQDLVSNLNGSTLVWITRLSQIDCIDPRWAQSIGTTRSIRNELLVDLITCEVKDLNSSLDGILGVYTASQTRKDDPTMKPDYEFAIIDGVVSVPRIYPFSMAEELGSNASTEDVVGLDMQKPGRLSSMRWKVRETTILTEDDVEVEIHAAGLNFRDVQGALGIIPFPETGLGLEAAGVVKRIGPKARKLRPGDRVMLLADGCFASHSITSEQLCAKIPDTITFEDAATIPAAYATAISVMFDIGSIERGQSVLIHSACGGVGIAALKLAQMVGAEIFATVGSDVKVQYLIDNFGLSRNHIFSSRDASFVKGIMRETNNRGVDLVLNSLSGELLHASWRCVAEFGKMVEIGKRDIVGAAQLDMSMFLQSRSYACFDLAHLIRKRKSTCKHLLESIRTYIKHGHITTITPKTVFDAPIIEEAIKEMQQGTHIGKLVISMRDTNGSSKLDMNTIKNSSIVKYDGEASYLLIGGLGGVGRAVARRMVEHGARHLVFLSRSAKVTADNESFMQELDSLGCKVRLVKGSIANEADVAAAISQAPKLKGIMQCSMVLNDESFPRMTIDQWNAATLPKVQGTWNLHNATVAANIELDFFVLFSSISGVFGPIGQANYAGGNTFLDAFVQFRKGLGLAASSVQIGPVQDIGFVSQNDTILKRVKASNTYLVTEAELLDTIIAATSIPTAGSGKSWSKTGYAEKNTLILGLDNNIPLSSPESRAIWKTDRRMAIFHNTIGNSILAEANGSEADSNKLKTLLAAASSDPTILEAEQTRNMLAQEIGKQLFDFLLKSGEDIDTSVPLSQLGMDSLVGVEMRSWWRQEFKFDISVLEMMGLGSLDALAKHAAETLAKSFAEGA